MAISLLETLKSQLSDELIGLLSRLTGEQPALTQAAAERAGEATLAGLLRQGATSEGATALAKLLNDRNFHGSALTDLPAQLHDSTSATGLIDQGKALLTSLFGERVDGLVRWISNNSGVGHGSAFSMMSLIAPTVLNFIKRQFSGNTDASGLWNYLSGERSALERSAPAGLLPVLGWRDWSMASANVTDTARGVQATPARVSATPIQEERKDSSWYWLALPLLLLLATGLFMMGGNNSTEGPVSSAPAVKEPPKVAPAPVAPKPEVVTPAPTPQPAPTPAIPATTEPQPVELVLHDNVKLMVWPDSIERRLVTFIEDKSKAPDDKTWFTFDRLDFETGSATLKPTSQERLKHVAAVLKAYPSVRIKIGGYTDNTGDPQKNLKLSDDRAKAAKQVLVTLGIDGNRVEAEGYGEQHPVADNATEEGRQKNRRVDIRVTAK